MGERDDAKHHIEQARARMTAVAREVSRRMTADYAKDKVRDMARREAMDMKVAALEHPWFAQLLGAGIGLLVGRAVISSAQERRTRAWQERDRWYREAGPRYPNAFTSREERSAVGSGAYAGERVSPDEGGGVGEPASELKERAGAAAAEIRGRLEDKASEMKDRAMEAKDRLSDKVGEYRERIARGAGAISDSIPTREAISSSTREQPVLWALGATAVGALLGLALPISEGERQVLEPAREKLRDVGSQAMDEAASRMNGQKGEQAEDDQGEQRSPATVLTPSASESLATHEPLH